jgi:hypothetical protein
LPRASGWGIWLADRLLRHGRTGLVPFVVLGALVLLLGMGGDFAWRWSAGIRPTENSFRAAVYANQFWQGLHAAITTVMALYLVARVWAGLIDPVRRVTFDNIRLFWFYTVVQALVGMALTHHFPRGLPV